MRILIADSNEAKNFFDGNPPNFRPKSMRTAVVEEQTGETNRLISVSSEQSEKS